MSQVARKTILDSIYALRRRRSVLPLSDLSNRCSPIPNDSSSLTKSLIQGLKVKAAHSTSSSHGNGNGNVSSHGNGNSNGALNITIPVHENSSQTSASSHQRLFRPGVTPRSHNLSLTRPSLLHTPVECHSNSFGLRKNYVATNDYVNFTQKYDCHQDLENSANTNEKESDLIVVLDLDECLIHSQFLNSGPKEIYRQQEERPQSHAFKSREEAESIVPSACESFRMALPDGDLVHVNKRPNLDAFLRSITSKYETHIFTAAMEIYASPLLDILDPKNEMFQGRWYRDDCTYDPSLGVYVKDLKRALGRAQVSTGNTFNEERVVLIDNNPMSFLANPKNGILVCNFYDDPKDDTLRAVTELLAELDEEPDVRPVLHNKFGLKDALREAVNAPASSTWK